MRTQFILRINDFDIAAPDNRNLFNADGFNVRKSDRVLILGANGAGKTTFLKRVVAQFDEKMQTEQVKFNPQTRLGYYDQELEAFDFEKSLFSTVQDALIDMTHGKIRSELVTAGFPFERHDSLVKELSGGERARLKLLILKLTKPNLILLDEPTNHIDVDGCEQLEQVVQESTNAYIIVSHDRTFIENVASRMFLIRDGALHEVPTSKSIFSTSDHQMTRRDLRLRQRQARESWKHRQSSKLKN